MRSEKDIFIAELSQHLSSNAGGTTQKPKFKRTKFLGKLSPMGLVLTVAFVAGAVLISSYFTVYFATQSGEIILGGQEAPLFLFDGHAFTGDTCARPLDVDELNPDDIVSTPHTISNVDSGFYRITFAYPDLNPVDVMDPFYGVYFEINSFAIDTVPTTLENLVIGPGQDAQFNYRWEVDHEFVDPDMPLSAEITATISPYVETFIDAVLDSIPLATIEQDLMVLANDNTGIAGVMITSIDGSTLPSGTTMTISPDGQHIDLHTDGASPRPWTATYTITSNATPALVDTASVTITT